MFLLAYLVLIMADILATWIPGGFKPSLMSKIRRFTQPYLGIFRRMKIFILGNLDFSVFFALVVLQILLQISLALASPIYSSLALILALIVEMIFSSLRFFLVFFLVLALIRFVTLLMKLPSVNRFLMTLDHLLQPLIYPLMGRLVPRRQIPYGTALGFFSAGLFALWLILGGVSQLLTWLCMRIPF